ERHKNPPPPPPGDRGPLRFRNQVEPRTPGNSRSFRSWRVRCDRDDSRSKALRASPRFRNDSAQRRGPVDANFATSCIAPDGDGTEVKLVGLERRMAVEIVGERLLQVLLDCGRQAHFLAQHLTW